MKFPLFNLGTVEIDVVTSTESPSLHPDLAPGMAQERDAGLDEAAQGPTAEPIDCDAPSEDQAAESVDAAINAGRAAAGL